MINIESIIALENSFVSIDRLQPPQILRGADKSTKMTGFEQLKDTGIRITADCYSIVVSPTQNFIISPNEVMEAHYLREGDTVLTVYGFIPITKIDLLCEYKDMASIKTDSQIILAEGFYLLSE